MEQQNTKKLSDKAFARLALTSILGILVCIVCLSTTTYAWFTGSVPSENNKIQTADACLISATVYKGGAEEATIDTQNPITLQCEGTYTVTLTLPRESASGYLVLSVDGADYYTDYLQRNDSADQSLTFTLNVPRAKSITFTARWGIFSGECHVDNGGSLTIE